MGKKKVSTKDIYNSKIAVCMVTQYKRAQFIPLLFESISNQTYPKNLFVEFIIVDGSKDESQQPLYEKWLHECNKVTNFPIKYISTVGIENKNVGALRNISLKNVSEDKGIEYIICLDDDDYQFSQRFRATVKAFKKYKTPLVGCSDQYMYDFNTDTTLRFKTGVFGAFHSVASSYSMTYEYAKNNFYDETITHAEENSFTKNFSVPMAQIKSNENIVGFSYGEGNTFNKVNIVLGNILNRNEKQNTADTYIQDGLMEKIIGKKTFEKWIDVIKQVSRFEEKSEYDVTYFTTNGIGIQWSPFQNGLGGSEHHIQEITKYWAKKGLKCEVYCNLAGDEKQITYEGVDYKHYLSFDYRKHYNTLIFWRHIGILILEHLKFNANQIYCDWHDSAKIQFDIATKKQEELTGVMVKHAFHQEVGNFLSKPFKHNFDKNKVYTIPNGVRKEVFSENVFNVEKKRHKCVYASSYVRGLVPFLKYSFPIIKAAVPEFEIHICYGMKQETKEFQDMMRENYLHLKGVFEYGNLEKEQVARLKWSCGFHLYPCLDPLPEIFCISLHESYLTKTIPFTFNCNLFKQLPAIHCTIDDLYQKYQGDDLEKACYERYAQSFIDVYKNASEEELDNIRNSFVNYDGVKTWEQVADMWINVFKQNEKIENTYEII